MMTNGLSLAGDIICLLVLFMELDIHQDFKLKFIMVLHEIDFDKNCVKT